MEFRVLVCDRRDMRKFTGVFMLGALLGLPVFAQDSRHYEDKAHHDSHDWNASEDDAWRRYLEEHHRKAHDFAKASRREQSDYWNWRHSHPDSDRR